MPQKSFVNVAQPAETNAAIRGWLTVYTTDVKIQERSRQTN